MAEKQMVTNENTPPKQITNKAKLQNYLRERGLGVTGTKQELLDRVRGGQTQGYDSIGADMTGVEKHEADRACQRLLTPQAENLPDPSSIRGWKSDCGVCPTFTQKEIYNYFVLSRKTFARSHASAQKIMSKAEVIYKDGRVSCVEYHEISDTISHCFIRCTCLPSSPGTSAVRKPVASCWICVSKVTAHVNSAKCDCVAGLGEACNHIAALMLALVDITEEHRDGKLSPTSKACGRTKPRSRAMSRRKATDISFSGQPGQHGPTSTTTQSDHSTDHTTDHTADEERVLAFKLKLAKSTPNAAWLKNFKCENVGT